MFGADADASAVMGIVVGGLYVLWLLPHWFFVVVDKRVGVDVVVVVAVDAVVVVVSVRG